MAGDAFRRVVTGERLEIPAAAYNAFIDAALANGADLAGDAQGGPHGGTVLIKNASGADRAQFDVLGIDAVLWTPTEAEREFKNRAILTGVTPAAASHAGKFVILREPILNGKIGRAWAAGVCVARVNVTDEAATAAEAKDADGTQLASAATGSVQILWRESGTGTKWAVVRLSNADPTPRPQVVKVANDGGAAGDMETPCTFTYTITDLGEAELAAGLTPALARTALGAYLPAGESGRSDLGLAILIDAAWVLLIAFGEVPDVSNCIPPE